MRITQFIAEKRAFVIKTNGDKTNYNLSNLILISREQLAQLNRNKLIKKDSPELTETGILLVKVRQLAEKRKKEVKRSECTKRRNKIKKNPARERD